MFVPSCPRDLGANELGERLLLDGARGKLAGPTRLAPFERVLRRIHQHRTLRSACVRK